MNTAEYVEGVKTRLLTDLLVTAFMIRRERVTAVDAHLRVRLELADGSLLEFSEYVQHGASGEIAVVTYSYHWVDAEDKLILRWDNTPHFPGLANFPHHIHQGDDNTVAPGQPVDIFSVLDQIAQKH